MRISKISKDFTETPNILKDFIRISKISQIFKKILHRFQKFHKEFSDFAEI